MITDFVILGYKKWISYDVSVMLYREGVMS